MPTELPQETQQTPDVQVIRNGNEVRVLQDGKEIANSRVETTARAAYDAAKAARDELQEQLERLRETRSSVARGTREGDRSAADIQGLETRLKQIDERIVDMEKQIQAADLKVVQAAGVPGAKPPEKEYVPDNSVDWDGVFAGGAFLSFALLFPFVIAYSRRIWRRSAKMTVTLPPEVGARIQAMEDAIESVAVEVERIGEGQRFMTQALAESPRGLGAGAAEPIVIRAREAVLAERPL